jgi:Cu+-exporting ATPase
MMHRRSFIQTLAGSGAGVALLKLGTPEKRLTENASVAWTVKGFTCVTCAVGLQTILEKHEGIARVKANYPSGQVHVAFDSTRIAAAEIKRLIEDAGFTVTAEGSGPAESHEG